jgi:hypothetical protein
MTDLKASYSSKELFPLFANRLLSSSRSEYSSFLKWLAMSDAGDDPLALLARTGGIRETDSLMVFARPERTREGTYHTKFFAHGLAYLPDSSVQTANGLPPETRLFLMRDPQNPDDENALALRTDDPKVLVGYCPRYLAQDFGRLLRFSDTYDVQVKIERANPDAPLQLRLLCSLTAPWPKAFQPCSGRLYAPIPGLGKGNRKTSRPGRSKRGLRV